MNTEAPLSFTWNGERIPWVGDVDDWTLSELRDVEALGATLRNLSESALQGAMLTVSIARATGQRIAAVDARVSFGDVRRCTTELAAQRRERVEREAAALLDEPPVDRAPDGGEVLSPTSAGSEQPA